MNLSKKDFHNLSPNDVLKRLKSSKKGLSEKDAKKRLKKYGFNQLKKEEGISPWKILLRQFNSLIIWVLMVAAIISLFIGKNLEAIVIGIILICNAIIGFIQEYKAEKAIEALKEMTALEAKVIRNNKIKNISAKRIVPGDIILLSEGDVVPADARIIEIHSLDINEAPLTGESLPVSKSIKMLKKETILADRINMVYSGTSVMAGKAKAIVTSTGMHTELGKIAEMIGDIKKETSPINKKINSSIKLVICFALILATSTVIIQLFKGEPIIDLFLTAMALAVSSIPQSLPAVITITLALAIQRMIKRKALIKKLPSVETLGSTTVICTDKTGTLTQNKMEVSKIYANNSVTEMKNKKELLEKKFLFEIGVLCNNSEYKEKEYFGDPTEIALLKSAEVINLNKNYLDKKYKRIKEIAFTSEKKYMATYHKIGNKTFAYIKGAPDIILNKCTKVYHNGKIIKLNKNNKKNIEEVLNDFSDSALRVLGFAFKQVNDSENDMDNLVFVGLQGMHDPPRPGIKEAIKKCKDAGIKVIMTTGDHKNTAQAIGREIGLTGKVIDGSEIENIPNLSKIVNKVSIFSRVNPSHKLKIIEALKARGHIVAMTGDGINDAPALKKSDIGIAMGITGTNVAKEASDIILTNDNFASIVDAVEEGRGVYSNIKKFVGYLISCNLAEILTIFIAVAIGLPLPLVALQILWVNLVTDGFPALALSADPVDPGIMNFKPRDPKENIITKMFGIRMVILTIIISILTLSIFRFFLSDSLLKAQTMAFTAFVLLEIIAVFIVRAHYTNKLFSNSYLWGAAFISTILQVLLIYSPLNKVFTTMPLNIIEWSWILGFMTILCIFGIFLNKFMHYLEKRMHVNE